MWSGQNVATSASRIDLMPSATFFDETRRRMDGEVEVAMPLERRDKIRQNGTRRLPQIPFAAVQAASKAS